MATSTVEDYVKAIYAVSRDAPTGEATVVRLAATLGVTKGSVTSMVRKLREAKLVQSERYGGIRLTARGRTLALDMIRRHRLIEVFLVETLGLDWAEVHQEAERLEHAVSARVLERLDEFLGHPAIDPHGDPIPDADGRVAALEGRPLSEFDTGAVGEVVRVGDEDPDFLGFAAGHGLTPGARVRVIDRVGAAGSITVRVGRRPGVTMSLAAAGRVLVR